MFEHLCKEKDGAIWRAVWPVQPTVEWAAQTVEKLSKVENFLPSFNPFSLFFDPDNCFLQVDDIGVMAILPIAEWPGLLHVHITFWDGRLRGREGLCRTAATWVMKLTGKMLFTQIPVNRIALIAFAERVGFVRQSQIGNVLNFVFTNYTE